MYKLAEAVHDEAGRLGWENKSIPGDQYDTEVIIRDISQNDEKWDYVYRCKDALRANIIGESALQCAVNNNISYDQSRRLELWKAWMMMPANAKNLMFITYPVNTDCSAMTAVCVLNAGISVDPNMRTASEDMILMGTGMFSRIPYTQGMILFKGDILLRRAKYDEKGNPIQTGHSAVVYKGAEKELPKPIMIGKVNQYSGVYSKPVKKRKYHVKAWPYVGKGNMVTVWKEEGKFYYCDVAGVFGYILKTRVDKAA